MDAMHKPFSISIEINSIEDLNALVQIIRGTELNDHEIDKLTKKLNQSTNKLNHAVEENQPKGI